MPKSFQQAFLSGFFSHGSIFYNECLYFGYGYKPFLRTMQQVLLNFGIFSTLEKMDKNKNQYHLRIDKEYFALFAEQIGMRNSVRKKLLNDYIEKYKDIQKTDQHEVILDEIISIEKVQARTFDLTIPETHSFVQNGILGSNTGGRCIALSTPNGGGENWFYKQWIAATKGESNFHPYKLMWDKHPHRDKEWLEKEGKDMTQKDLDQEYRCFDANTRIYTSSGLKRMEEVRVGDSVLTHKGRWRKIKEKRSRMSEVYKVHTSLNRNDTFVSPEHPILLENKEWMEIEKIGLKQKVCSFPKNIESREGKEEIKNPINDIVPCKEWCYGEDENWFYSAIIKKELQKEEMEVFNISVEEDESFITEHFVVHNCEFHGSGDTVISGEVIQEYEKIVRIPEFTVGRDQNVWIWEPVQSGEDYILVADAARGDGEDYQAFQITKISDLKVVAEYKGEMKREYFAETIAEFGEDYNNALVVVENNTYGYAVLEDLRDKIKYENLFYSKREPDGHIDYVPALIGEHDSEAKIGIHTNAASRDYFFLAWEKWMEHKKITCLSERWLGELSTFIWKNGKRQAQKGANDDLIICSAITSYVIERHFRDNIKQTGVQTDNFSGIMVSKRYMQTTIPGQSGHRPTKESIIERYQKDNVFFLPIIKG